MRTIPERFARAGKELLGCGDAALVWARTSDDWVIKVGYDGADAWPEWVVWCRVNPGPHVPLVHACQLFEHAGRREAFVAAVERLQPTLVAARWLKDDRDLKRDPMRLAGHVEAEHPTVAALLRSAAAAFPAARWDMAPSNWMERASGDLVLMDPISRL